MHCWSAINTDGTLQRCIILAPDATQRLDQLHTVMQQITATKSWRTQPRERQHQRALGSSRGNWSLCRACPAGSTQRACEIPAIYSTQARPRSVQQVTGVPVQGASTPGRACSGRLAAGVPSSALYAKAPMRSKANSRAKSTSSRCCASVSPARSAKLARECTSKPLLAPTCARRACRVALRAPSVGMNQSEAEINQYARACRKGEDSTEMARGCASMPRQMPMQLQNAPDPWSATA